MKTIHDRLIEARRNAGFVTAQEAADAMGVPYPTYAGHENGSAGIRSSVAAKYSRKFKVSIDWLVNGVGPVAARSQVPLKGKVGAGAVVYALDDGGDDMVDAPAGSQPGTVAVQVDGDSMFPAYEEGTLLYYSRLLPPSNMLNRRCVVQLGSGKIYVKVLRKGTTDNTWTLQSLNPLYADMTDEVVEWAAPIDWTKPRY